MFSVAVFKGKRDKGVLVSYRINFQGFFKLPCVVVYQGTTILGFCKNSLFMSSISGYVFYSSLLESQSQKVDCVKKDLKDCIVPTPPPWTKTPSARAGCSRSHPAWFFGEALLSLSSADGRGSLDHEQICPGCCSWWSHPSEGQAAPLGMAHWALLGSYRDAPSSGFLAVWDGCQPAHSLGWDHPQTLGE